MCGAKGLHKKRGLRNLFEGPLVGSDVVERASLVYKRREVATCHLNRRKLRQLGSLGWLGCLCPFLLEVSELSDCLSLMYRFCSTKKESIMSVGNAASL